MAYENMTRFGLTDEIEKAAQEYIPEYTVGRIISQEKGLYRLVSEDGEQLAEVSGKLRYSASSVSDLPAVGDFVLVNTFDTQSTAVIHAILPRKSIFVRKAAGTANTEQVVAANIDTVFICMSLNNDFNLRRLERYLSVAWNSGAVPIIVLTKSDLCDNTAEKLCEVETVAVGTDIVLTSGTEKDGFLTLLPYIKQGQTVAFIGSSGVGKSTLINRLLGEDRLETNGLRNDDKGRHTTTRRELFLLKNGAMVIDTPGMRELGMWDSESGLDRAFEDIEQLALHCRFNNCTHTTEPGCAVKQAIMLGELSESRWNSYQKLTAENRFSENSKDYLAEKRQKFKNIAKINKSAHNRKDK